MTRFRICKKPSIAVKDADGLMDDDDLKGLQTDPKFQQLVAELKRPTTK